ncbi:MAG: NifU family protein [Chloroflexota bacterium]|nr:NifU family protein [Anaerolineales bacterium]MCB8967652.1 NifU family protein [Ardenticatenaceae bacterium]
MSTLYAGGKPDISDLSTTQSTEERMRALINTLSDYITHYHGGAVEMVSFDGHHLQVRMTGACEGCALAPATLKGWVAGTVKQFFPEVNSIEAV